MSEGLSLNMDVWETNVHQLIIINCSLEFTQNDFIDVKPEPV